MVSTRQRSTLEPAPPPALGRRLLLTSAATVAIIVLVALGSYLTVERTIRVARAASLALTLTEHERMLAQRVAGLAARYAFGEAGVRPELRAATAAFESVHWHLVGGDPIGVRSAIADPPLRKIYFNGGTPLDALATQYVTRARRIASSRSDDPTLAAQAAPLVLAAQGPLVDELGALERLRRARADAQFTQLNALAAACCWTLLVALLAGVAAVFRPMARRIAALERENAALARHATIDPLTGTLNGPGFHARGAIEVHKARPYRRPLSLLMINADGLGAIENAYGPGGSETVLKALTSSFFAGTRVCDLVGRVEGEQFAILLPETTCDGATLLAERLRQTVSSLTVAIADNVVSCTVSIGVAAAEKDAAFLWPTFKRADEALYEAKMRGRNQVVVAA